VVVINPATCLQLREACLVVRVALPGRPAFQLRKGEEGLSVFDTDAVDPPLKEAEILSCFRPGSQPVVRSAPEIAANGLVVVPVPGVAPLPTRLRDAHAEIRPGPGMTRDKFKQALKELE
jgi:hypothetical protein